MDNNTSTGQEPIVSGASIQSAGTFSFLRIRSESVSLSGISDFDSISDFSNRTDDTPLSLPEQIGYYKLGERLGEGGMGAVYQATHVLLKREAAIKFIRRSRISPEALDRFARETEIAGKLSDAHLVAAYDAGEVNGIPFLVMERLEGQTLAEYIAKNGPVSPVEAVDIVVQAAQGLSCAHKAGLIHRDVKPGNIWITPKGTVKILDLGLSETREEDVAEAGESKTLAGTPDYMAPEQANPLGVVDERADLYALGCVLFFLLTGRAPFDDPNHDSTRQKLAAQMFEPLPRLAASVPKQFMSRTTARLQTVLDKMTRKEPTLRFSDMDHAVEALNRSMQGRFAPSVFFAFAFAAVLLAIGTLLLLHEKSRNLVSLVTPAIGERATESNVPPVPDAESNAPSTPNSTNTTESTVPPVPPVPDAKSNAPSTPNSTNTTESTVPPAPPVPDAESNAPTTPNSTNTPGTSTEESFQQGPFPVGKKAGESYTRLVDGVEYSFRWCPPGTFTMGTHDELPEIKDDMSFDELLAVAQKFKFLDDKEIKLKKKEYKELSSHSEDADSLKALQFGLYHDLKLDIIFDISDFLMNNPRDEFKHQVTFTHGFWLLESEVTQQMWNQFMTAPAYYSSKGEGRAVSAGWDTSLWPITNISWHEAQTFCQNISKKTGINITLPSDAQWEYACRAGAKENVKNIEIINEMGWFSGSGERRPHEVKTKTPNAWGVYDMFGNAEEWCSDWYVNDLGLNPVVDPTGGPSSKIKIKLSEEDCYKVLKKNDYDYSNIPFKVIRGGGFANALKNYRGKPRTYGERGCVFHNKYNIMSGFRICVNVLDEKTEKKSK